MPIDDEDVAVGRHQYVGGAVELVLTVACHAGRAQAHQKLALRAELVHLVTLVTLAAGVGDPDVALAIDVNSVRPDDHPRSEAPDDVSVRVEEQHRIEVVAPHATVGLATLADPDVTPVDIGIHGARRPPLPAVGHLRPAVDGGVGVGRVILRLDRHGERDQDRGGDEHDRAHAPRFDHGHGGILPSAVADEILLNVECRLRGWHGEGRRSAAPPAEPPTRPENQGRLAMKRASANSTSPLGPSVAKQ